MNKWIKWGAFGVGALLVLAALVIVAGKGMGEQKMARTVRVDVAPVAVVADAAHIEQGRYLFNTRGCAECHGSNGAGKVVIDDGGMLVASPNLTSGSHGVTVGYQPVDWVRTLRHGVKPGGQPVMIMPSEDYNRITDDDLGALIAYIRQMPAADGQVAQIKLPLPVKVLYGFGAIEDAAAKIDHKLPPALPVARGVTVEHGAYVANTCLGCHGDHLSGGKIPGGPPSWPAAANLTPGGGSAMVRYPTAELFIRMLRSGHRPDGTQISKVMPFMSLGAMSDVDMGALHLFLKSVPAREAGNR
ncbi:MAG: cytochrome c [Pseudomonadota bacterium]